MIDVRHAYALAREIDGRWHILTHWRDNSVVVCLQAEIEPIIAAKKDIEEHFGGDVGVQIVRIIDRDIVVVKDPQPLKIGSMARGIRLDDNDKPVA